MTTTQTPAARLAAAEAAVAFAAKRSNRVPARAYQQALTELTEARAAVEPRTELQYPALGYHVPTPPHLTIV